MLAHKTNINTTLKTKYKNKMACENNCCQSFFKNDFFSEIFSGTMKTVKHIITKTGIISTTKQKTVNNNMAAELFSYIYAINTENKIL